MLVAILWFILAHAFNSASTTSSRARAEMSIFLRQKNVHAATHMKEKKYKEKIIKKKSKEKKVKKKPVQNGEH